MLKDPTEAMQVDTKTLPLNFPNVLHRRNPSCYFFARSN